MTPSPRSLFRSATLGLTALLAAAGSASADPCGMVPPVYVGDDVPIVRTGDQNTYVFFKDGVETFIIRPGYEGKVEEFGMLIPFPSVPALRKVSDNIFPHVRAAIDPPEVVVDLRPRLMMFNSALPQAASAGAPGGLTLGRDEVRVLKEEAVGMYEVAVLEAGSAAALQKWMDGHGYSYPTGMDKACEEYVTAGWCFVAVKTRVGPKQAVDPRPGMRKVDSGLPAGATFDGHVQAMGFRFETDRPVIPMRLSTFNEGDLHNIVYLLSDQPQKLRSVPEEYVVRQLPGEQLFRNLTEPLPLRIIGGTVKDIPEYRRKTLPQQRNPVPHNGAARDVIAADLLAVSEGRLSHPHEEQEKMLLRIGEALSLRGPDVDRLNEAALAEQREKIVETSLKSVQGMTLSVIDGNFPRAVLAGQNLSCAPFEMPARRNSAEFYDAKTKTPAAKQQEGILHHGKLSAVEPARDTMLAERGEAAAHQETISAPLRHLPLWLGLASVAIIGLIWSRRHGEPRQEN